MGSRWYWIIGLWLMGLLLAGCAPVSAGPSPERGEQETAPAVDQVVVWVGLAGVRDVLQLEPSELEQLRTGALVISDDQPEGWETAGDCVQLYAFENSGLIKALCPYVSVVVKTLSAEIQVQQAWVAVTYDPPQQVTVVSVLDAGVAETTQVVARPAGSVKPRVLGEPTTLTPGTFWFSQPGVMPAPVAGLRARWPHPLARLPDVTEAFGLWIWHEKVALLARSDRVPFPDLQPLVAASTATPGPTRSPADAVRLIKIELSPTVEGPAAAPTPTPILATKEPYPSPQLLQPAPRAQFRNVPITFKWHYDGVLGPNDYFDVRVWYGGQPAKGIAWTREPELTIQPNDILWRFGPGFYHWSVVVVRGENGQWLADLSRPSETRSFEWLPR